MRILFDSKKNTFKEPFGTLTVGQSCTMHIHIPSSVAAKEVSCLFFADGELRLTADLKHGFSLREKDLGCYALGVEERSSWKIW